MVRELVQTETGNGQASSGRAQGVRTTLTTVRVIEAKQLTLYQEAWVKLAGVALVPNPFYEPWMLLLAVDALVNKENLRFLLVFGPAEKEGPAPLWGFFPLEIQPDCMSIPVRTMAFWQHRWCYQTAPLIDAAHCGEALAAFWRWFERNPLGCRILDTNQLPADGAFHAVWADFAIGRTSFALIDFPRALLRPTGTALSYIRTAVSKKHSDHYLRQERRLHELGKLEYRQVASLPEVDPWVDEFLCLEANGWKGRDGGRAFAKRADDSAYLRTTAREGFLQNRVVLLSLTLDDKAVAMKFNILAGDGSFIFRIAYDENFSKYSPGALLEIENIRRLCDDPRTRWMDTCTEPRHPLYNRIFRERRMLRRTLFSNSSRLGDFWISLLPALRWVKKQLRPSEPPDHLRISTRVKISET